MDGMDKIFPCGFPAPTAAYLVLYVVTLVIHVLFMNYVLAGSAVLAIEGLYRWSTHGGKTPSPTRELLRDWLPFALSAAITAGIAPLLFVQILYQRQFYTANLLLEHRWMVILPVLIVGFYLLYLLKSKAIASWKPWQRALTGAVAMLCFWFTAYTWTENHMLSLHDEQWTDFYEQGRFFFWDPQMVPRLTAWVMGAFPTMALLVAWQLRQKSRAFDSNVAAGTAPEIPESSMSAPQAVGSVWHPASVEPAVRTLAVISLLGMAVSAAGGLWYYSLGNAAMQAALLSPLAGPYLIAAAVGSLIQAIGWFAALKTGKLHTGILIAQSAGLLLTLCGMSVAREAIRLSAIPIAMLYDQHAHASTVGGFPLFILFMVVNALLIAYCIKLARPKPPAQPS
ncbi:MAG TPA: hypothetical protein VL860_05690 [Planctomycetota bacterium]|nr:hypothetical protein [Planctomycetota bacterium]